jgi:hypothetical protein
MQRFVTSTLALCAVAALLVPWPVAHAAMSIVALSGEQAPGPGVAFTRFSSPILNAEGIVAFQAALDAPSTDVFPHGIWVGAPHSLRALAVAGDDAAGVTVARYRTVGTPHILTSDGASLFYGNLVQEGGVTFDNDYGIWTGAPHDVRLFARKQDQAPQLPDDVGYSLFDAHPHASGRIGLSASLEGPNVDLSNGAAAWIGELASPQSLRLVARAGDPAPGLPPDWRFAGVGTPAPYATGNFALFATATSADPVAQQPGLWTGDSDELRLLAFAGDVAPGTASREFEDFGPPRLNNAGRLAFDGRLKSTTDEQRLNDAGIWAVGAVGDPLELIVAEGQQAPGFAPGVVFRGSAPGDAVVYNPFGDVVLGGGGQVAFRGTVFGVGLDFDHNDGVWRADPFDNQSGLSIVAREGDHPPGTSPGTRFAGTFTGEDLLSAFEQPLINAEGQLAFEARTIDAAGDIGRGIWATDAAGNLHLIAHTGQSVEAAPGDLRVITTLKLQAGGSSEDGFFSAFNDAGQLAFAMSFADNSEAVVLATVVPECGTITIVGGGFLALTALGRRNGRSRFDGCIWRPPRRGPVQRPDARGRPLVWTRSHRIQLRGPSC